MTYFTVSHVTEADLAQAEREVLQRETQELPFFLNLDWAPWQRVLERRFPQDYTEAREEINRILGDDEEFNGLITRYIQQKRLIDDDNTRTRVAVAVKREIEYEIMAPLSKRFYSQYGE